MVRARGDKKQIGRGEALAFAGANILAAAGSDEIDFIALVRSLWIGPAWCIYLDYQAAVFENSGKALVFRARKAGKSIGYGETAAGLFVVHVKVLEQKRGQSQSKRSPVSARQH
jgi:hypothetical protein